MSEEHRSIEPRIVAAIRQQMEALDETVQEMESNLQLFWVDWQDYYLYEAIVDRVNEARTLLAIFNNTADPISPSASEIQHRIYRFTTLTKSLQRSVSVLAPIAVSDVADNYQQFLVTFAKFCLQVTKLEQDNGYFC
jgi:flagellar motor switch protein FliG